MGKNIYFEAAIRSAERANNMEDEARKHPVPPIGMRPMTRENLEKMTPQEIAKAIGPKREHLKQVVRLVRGKAGS